MTTQYTNTRKLLLTDLTPSIIDEITKFLDPVLIVKLLPESFYPSGTVRVVAARMFQQKMTYENDMAVARSKIEDLDGAKGYYQRLTAMYLDMHQKESDIKDEMDIHILKLQGQLHAVRQHAEQLHKLLAKQLDKERVKDFPTKDINVKELK